MTPSPSPTTATPWALLVIDMQNAFCHPQGSFAQMLAGSDMSIDMCTGAIPGCERLISHAHLCGAPVIFTRFVYHQGYVDGGVLLKKYPDIPATNALAAGTWDADLVDQLQPQAGDLVIDKSRYSAFHSTRLPSILTSLKIEAVVICGVTTNICVESTARDAAQLDYEVIVVEDAVGELTRARHDNALAIIDYGFGTIMTTDTVETTFANN